MVCKGNHRMAVYMIFADLGVKCGRQTGSAIDYNLYLSKSTNHFSLYVLIRDDFNGTIYFLIRQSNMAARQEVPSITTYIYPNRLIILVYRF